VSPQSTAGPAAIITQAPPPHANDCGLTRPEKDARAYCAGFPNDVVLDQRLDPPALVTLAYRSTFTGLFALNENNLKRIVAKPGFGKNVRRRAISDLKRCRYLERPLNATLKRVRGEDGRHHFAKAQESLHLPEGPGEPVRRSWFNEAITVNEFAALLVVRAKGIVSADDLEKRFGWSPPTALKVIGSDTTSRSGRRPHGLLARGLLQRIRKRNAQGHFGSVTYCASALSEWSLTPQRATTHKKRGHGQRGSGKAGNNTYPLAPTQMEIARKEDGNCRREEAQAAAATWQSVIERAAA
jgi:hypothetical protein